MLVLNAPLLCCILPALTGFDVIAPTLGSLLRQSQTQGMEILLLTPDSTRLPQANQGYRIVQFPETLTLDEARDWAVQQTEAPWVAMLEDHVVLESDWFAALLPHLRSDYQALGTACLPGNPGTRIARASNLLSYGEWMWPCASGERRFLPGHNSLVRRGWLLERGSQRVFQALRTHKQPLYLVGDSYFRHWEPSTLSSVARISFANATGLGYERTRDWPKVLRLAWALSFLAIAAAHWRRGWKAYHGAHPDFRPDLGTLIVAVYVAIFWGLGEAVGALAYTPAIQKMKSEAESNRWRYVAARECPLP